MYFAYGEEAVNYLCAKDKKLGEYIRQIGHIAREVDTDLFSSIVRSIIGQQISTKAQTTVWQRLLDNLGEVTPQSINQAAETELQSLGMTFRKANYIKDCAAKIINGEFDLSAVDDLSDQEAIKALTELKGVGVWTAEMILLFCLQRPDILSYDDLAIRRGMCLVYHHREMTRRLFEKYRRRLSPFGSVASLYFWAVANKNG